MVIQLHLSVILAVFSAALAHKDIKISCLKDSVSITWRIRPELVPYKSRFFLGNCESSSFDSGVGELHFNFKFDACQFKDQINGKHIVFRNKLVFRPQEKGTPAAFVYPFLCVAKRSDAWIPQFLNPGAGSSADHGHLFFHMALLNANLSDIAQNNVIPLGSFIPIWATVDQKAHQPLLLLIEECVVATTPQLHAESLVYPLVNNKGCLVESQRGNAMFLPRNHPSSIIMYFKSFRLGLGQEVYIHCKLVAWDPDRIDNTKKACYYSRESESWELLDKPEESSVCSCCASDCKARPRRYSDIESQGVRSISVVGPLHIVDVSTEDTQDEDTAQRLLPFPLM